MKPEFRYGLLGGLVYWAWAGLEELLGFHSAHLAWGEYSSWMAYVILFSLLYLLLSAAHRDMPMGRLEPWTALVKSASAALTYGVLLYVYAVAYTTFLNPHWIDTLLNWKVATLRTTGVTEEEIRSQIVAYRSMFSPAGLAVVSLVLYPLFGTIMGLLTSLWLNWRWEKAHLAQP